MRQIKITKIYQIWNPTILLLWTSNHLRYIRSRYRDKHDREWIDEAVEQCMNNVYQVGPLSKARNLVYEALYFISLDKNSSQNTMAHNH